MDEGSEADSRLVKATDVDGAAAHAAASSPKPTNGGEVAGEMEVDSYELFSPRGRKRLTKGGCYCCVPGCFNNSTEDRGRVKFYFLPKDRAQRSLWLARIGRHGTGWTPGATTKICGNHFRGGRKTCQNPDPTIFPDRQERRYLGSDESGERFSRLQSRKRRAHELEEQLASQTAAKNDVGESGNPGSWN